MGSTFPLIAWLRNSQEMLLGSSGGIGGSGGDDCSNSNKKINSN